MTALRRRLLDASALGWAALGAAALARPRMIPESLGRSADTATARTEIRAMYGGVSLAAAGLLAADARTGSGRGSLAMSVLTAGIGAGRCLGAALEDEPPDAKTKLFLSTEVALTLVAGYAAATAPRHAHGGG